MQVSVIYRSKGFCVMFGLMQNVVLYGTESFKIQACVINTVDIQYRITVMCLQPMHHQYLAQAGSLNTKLNTSTHTHTLITEGMLLETTKQMLQKTYMILFHTTRPSALHRIRKKLFLQSTGSCIILCETVIIFCDHICFK